MVLTDGDTLLSEKLVEARKVTSRPVVTSVLVTPAQPTRVVVALGDSITDGVRERPSEPHGWVATLAARMNAEQKSSGMAAVSAGISGNQILKSMMGPAALSRVDRDVFPFRASATSCCSKESMTLAFQERRLSERAPAFLSRTFSRVTSRSL